MLDGQGPKCKVHIFASETWTAWYKWRWLVTEHARLGSSSGETSSTRIPVWKAEERERESIGVLLSILRVKGTPIRTRYPSQVIHSSSRLPKRLSCHSSVLDRAGLIDLRQSV